MDKQNLLGIILSGVISGGVFVAFLFILGLSYWWAALLIAVGCYAGLLLFTSTTKKTQIKKTIRVGELNIHQLQQYTNQINKLLVQTRIRSIADTAGNIYEYLEKNPKHLKVAHSTLDYYFQTTFRILNHYVELHDKQISSEIEHAIRKIEETLDSIDVAFKKQLGKLLQNNIFDLDGEISTLQETIKSEQF